MFTLIYKLEMNVTMFYAWSHGVNNDMQGIFKELKVFGFCFLILVIVNMSNGLHLDEGMRFCEFPEM